MLAPGVSLVSQTLVYGPLTALRPACLQVLTVHSNVRIENHTSHALQFAVHLLRGRGGVPGTGAGATLSVPGSGSLAPGLQCYLPVAAARCAVLGVANCP